MNALTDVVDLILSAHAASNKPLAIVLAGHNGSGKSTCWQKHLSPAFQMPLVNADRLMLSILPEPPLPEWARDLRDNDTRWMEVGQKGVGVYVELAMERGLPFAIETVFSDWRPQADGSVRSKIDLMRTLQQRGYFVLLFFVGLASAQLSQARVATRIQNGGHAVPDDKLLARFPRTQQAITAASVVADAVILTDNSRKADVAFSICRITVGAQPVFDCRDAAPPPPEIAAWLDIVSPRSA